MALFLIAYIGELTHLILNQWSFHELFSGVERLGVKVERKHKPLNKKFLNYKKN